VVDQVTLGRRSLRGRLVPSSPPSRDPRGQNTALAAGLVLCVLAFALLAAVQGREPQAAGDGPAPVNPWRPFTHDSAWNDPIPDNPQLDAGSAAIAAYLSADGYGHANLYEYGVPVYEAGSSTPRHRVECRSDWGPCGLEEEPVPIPDGARPAPGSDGAMVVIDRSTNRSYDFWQARQLPDGSWTASWGGVVDTSGDGYTPGAGQTGAGVPRLAGVVRTFEIEQGYIGHALVFSTDNACGEDDFRYPASKSDGYSERPDCIPQGARIQLDPGIDIAAIPDITPAEKTVARALQTHGAYAIDNGGARMAFIFETPLREQDPYQGMGFTYDYFRLDHIPWADLRVLRQWDGG